MNAAVQVETVLKEWLGNDLLDYRGEGHEETVTVSRESLHALFTRLKNDPLFDLDVLMDLAGIDLLEFPKDGKDGGVRGSSKERFRVVYHLYSSKTSQRLRVKVPVSELDPVVSSVIDLYSAADWMEREAFDLMGIKFEGHPNLKRVLTHKDFVGHALRKDYPAKQGQWLLELDDMMDELGEAPDDDDHLSEMVPMNIGPSHPATHGTFRILCRLDGETVVKAVHEAGYLHRGFEKSVERSTYTQVVSYTDRLNYCSALMNNVGYCKTVESLLGVEIPDRTRIIRVILSEVSRIMDHFVCCGACLVDIGALTNFWYLFNVREKIYEVIEGLTGHRLTNTFVRIGGLCHDLQDGFVEDLKAVLADVPKAVDDVRGLIAKNQIFADRTVGVGRISGEDALNWGFTGPCLRASGVNVDLRKDDPYYGYEEFDFDIVLGANGDTHDRIMVRLEECLQSLRIIDQALKVLPDGPINIEDPSIVLPKKDEVYGSIEGLMNHFVLVYDGIKPPVGERYDFTEAANGELGFYVMSDGEGRPYRVKVRPPCFLLYSALPALVEGGMIADMVATLSSLNIIAGELDR